MENIPLKYKNVNKLAVSCRSLRQSSVSLGHASGCTGHVFRHWFLTSTPQTTVLLIPMLLPADALLVLHRMADNTATDVWLLGSPNRFWWGHLHCTRKGREDRRGKHQPMPLCFETVTAVFSGVHSWTRGLLDFTKTKSSPVETAFFQNLGYNYFYLSLLQKHSSWLLFGCM